MPYDETRFYGSLEKPGDEDLNEVSRQISRQMITIARGAGKSSELDCFLRQNLQKTAEGFFYHTIKFVLNLPAELVELHL